MNADFPDPSSRSQSANSRSNLTKKLNSILLRLKQHVVLVTLIVFLSLSGMIWLANDYQSDRYEQEVYGYDSSQWFSINDHPTNFTSGMQNEEYYTGQTGGTCDAARQMGIKDADWIDNNTDGYKGLIHIVMQPHWDVDYMRPYSVNMEDGARNIAEILDFCKIYPDITATFDAVLWIKAFWENYPQYRDDLIRFIRQGRIEIAQGSVSEFNMCYTDIESLIRDVVYGRNWVRSTLGVESDVAWFTDLLDPFNHAAGKMLKDAGFDYYYSARDYTGYDDEAYYLELDNDESLLCFHTGTYNNFPFQIEDFMIDFSTRLDNIQSRNLANKENILYTVGLDLLSPLPWMDNFVDLWNSGMDNLTGYRMVWSTPTRFFTALENTPSSEDYRHLSKDTADTKSRCSGTIASNGNYKIADRAYEEMLKKIETYGLFGAVGTSNAALGNRYNYNQELLRSGWWIKSIGHAHDTAVGVVVKKGNDAVTGRYLQGMSPLRDGLEDAERAFVGLNTGRCVLPEDVISTLGGQFEAQSRIDAGKLKVIAVANSNAWNTTQPVQFGWNWSSVAAENEHLVVLDHEGNPLPTQKVPYYNSTQFDVYNDAGKGLMDGYLGYKPVIGPDNPNIREWQTKFEFYEENSAAELNSVDEQFQPDWEEYDDYFIFLADTPSVGYSYYYVYENESAATLPPSWDIPQGNLAPSNIWLANRYYNVTFDETGSVISVRKEDQASGYEEFINPGTSMFDFKIQASSTASESKSAAYGLHIHGRPVINSSQHSGVNTDMWLEIGPVYAALHVSQQIYNSRYNRTFRLFSENPFLNYGFLADISPLDLELEFLDWHTLTTDLTFNDLNRQGYFGHGTDAALRSAGNSGDTVRYLHNWAYFEADNAGTVADNAERSMFIAMRGPLGVHLIENTNDLYVNHNYRRFLVRDEQPTDDRVTINNQTGIVSNHINVFFGNGSYNVNRTQMTELINEAAVMRHPLDVIGPIDCYADDSGFTRPDIVPTHSYLSYNYSSSSYDTANAVVSSIHRATRSNSIIIRAWNPFEQNISISISLQVPGTSTLDNIINDFRETNCIEEPKTMPIQTTADRMVLNVKYKSFNTVMGSLNNTIDLSAPGFSSYSIQGSFLGVGGNSIYVTTTGDDLKGIHVSFFKDPGGGVIDSDLIGKREGAPFDSWVYDLEYYISSPDWFVASSSDPIKSEIIDGVNHTKWRVEIPFGYKMPVEMPGSVIPEMDGSLSLKGVRYNIFAEDLAGNTISIQHNSYLPGINEYVIFFILIPALIVGLVVIMKVRKRRKTEKVPSNGGNSEDGNSEDKSLSTPDLDEAVLEEHEQVNKLFTARWWMHTKKAIWLTAEVAFMCAAVYVVSRPLVEKYYIQIAQESTEDMLIVPLVQELLGSGFNGPEFVSPAMFVVYLGACLLVLLVHGFIFGRKKYRLAFYYVFLILIANYVAVNSFNSYLVNTGGIPINSGYYYYFHPDGVFYQENALPALLVMLRFRYFIGDTTLVLLSLTFLLIPQIGFLLRKPLEFAYRNSARFLSRKIKGRRSEVEKKGQSPPL